MPKTNSEPQMLRFYAKGDLLVTEPGTAASTAREGRPSRYVGRKLAMVGEGRQAVASFPATSDPYSCPANSPRGARLIKLTRRDGSLWPADEATARACGVDYVATRFSSGEHVAVAAKKASKKES